MGIRRILLIPLTLATGVVCAAPARADDSAEDPPREFPYLADETPSGSISVGDTANGFLVEPARIDDSDRLAILPKQRERNLRYGTDQLVAALEEASVALFSATRTRLWIGNVARRGGGDIAWSVSHNSGRDADIAFCYLDAKGRPADPPELVALNNEGVSVKHGLRFDAARTWIVVRSLLESRHAQVQYLFIAAPLKNQLLMHAKRTGVPAALIQRAAEVLWQPGNGAGAHDDHLHLRVYCNERDAKGGCVDSGIIHPWYKGHELAKKKRIGEVAAFLRDDRPEQRRRAIERLVLMDARDHAADLARGIEDADAGVRQAAVRAMAAFGDETSAVRLRALHAREEDLQVRIAIVHAAARLGGKAAGEILTSAVGLPRPELGEVAQTVATWAQLSTLTNANPAQGLLSLLPTDDAADWQLAGLTWLDGVMEEDHLGKALQLSAIDAAAQGERLEPSMALASLLEDNRPEVRVAADRALSFITNARFATDWAHAPRVDRQLSVARWRATLQRSRSAPRDAWLVTGFRGAGYDVRQIHTKFAWELVRATSSADHLSFNAQRALMRLFDHRPPSLTWKKHDACLHWLRWTLANRTKYQLPTPTKDLARACADAKD